MNARITWAPPVFWEVRVNRAGGPTADDLAHFSRLKREDLPQDADDLWRRIQEALAQSLNEKE